jgi:hypothetical protein
MRLRWTPVLVLAFAPFAFIADPEATMWMVVAAGAVSVTTLTIKDRRRMREIPR